MSTVVAIIDKNKREHVRVALTRYREHDLIDVRVFAHDGADWIATPKGVSIRVAMLPELRAAVEEAERQARAAGLLGDGER